MEAENLFDHAMSKADYKNLQSMERQMSCCNGPGIGDICLSMGLLLMKAFVICRQRFDGCSYLNAVVKAAPAPYKGAESCECILPPQKALKASL